jgi:Fanconi anemia group J protein
MVTRWKATDLWSRLSTIKRCVVEPRTGGAELDRVMSTYLSANSGAGTAGGSGTSTPNKARRYRKSMNGLVDESKMTGGLFLAVCRGKVAEGIDFADSSARGMSFVY